MFANPLGLLGLLGVAAIVGLHLYRRRRPPVVVSALFLWDETPGAAGGGRTREPLRRTLSLIAELLCALLLTLALAGPRFGGAAEVRHYVAVLDASASMHAEAADGSTARDRARGHVRQMIDQLAQDARVSLVLTGPEPEILAGPFALAGEALARVDEAWPTFGEHAATGALLLAAELAGEGTVDFVTDAEPTGPAGDPNRIRHVAVGAPADNVGITGALRTPETGAERERDEVRIVVQNHGAAPRTVQLSGAFVPAREGPFEGAPDPRWDAPLTAEPFTVESGQSRASEWSIPAEAPTLVVTLTAAASAGNALALDDRVTLAPAPRKRLRLASTLDAAAARALGLRKARSAERWAAILPDAIAVDPTPADATEAPHLVIARAGSQPAQTQNPASTPTTDAAPGRPWRLQLGAAVGSEPTDLVGPYLLDRDPLLRGVSFDGVIWSMDEARDLPTTADTVLAFAGDVPLITGRIDQDGARTWTLRLDPVRSTIGRSTDWPILLANAAEQRRRALPGPERTELGLGERFLWRSAPYEELTLTSPTGNSVTFAPVSGQGSDWITPRLGEIGLWEVTRPDGEPFDDSGKAAVSVGVSLVSSPESDLTKRTGRRAPTDLPSVGTTEDSRSAGDTRVSPVRVLLALLALAFLALDWWALARAKGGSA